MGNVYKIDIGKEKAFSFLTIVFSVLRIPSSVGIYHLYKLLKCNLARDMSNARYAFNYRIFRRRLLYFCHNTFSLVCIKLKPTKNSALTGLPMPVSNFIRVVGKNKTDCDNAAQTHMAVATYTDNTGAMITRYWFSLRFS